MFIGHPDQLTYQFPFQMFQNHFFGSNDVSNRKNVVATIRNVLLCNENLVALGGDQETCPSEELETACTYYLLVIHIDSNTIYV
jgi:hypothetical protein